MEQRDNNHSIVDSMFVASVAGMIGATWAIIPGGFSGIPMMVIAVMIMARAVVRDIARPTT